MIDNQLLLFRQHGKWFIYTSDRLRRDMPCPHLQEREVLWPLSNERAPCISLAPFPLRAGLPAFTGPVVRVGSVRYALAWITPELNDGEFVERYRITVEPWL